MKGLGVTLGLAVLLGVLLLVAAAPTSAGGPRHGNDQAPPAWSHARSAPDGGQQTVAGPKSKARHAAGQPAYTAPITHTQTVTLCHKPGTPAEMTLVLPAPAVPGHLRHGDHEGACVEARSTVTLTETITVCHMPGTPAEKTLVLPASAEYGHVQHGDELGTCPGAMFAAAVSPGRRANRH